MATTQHGSSLVEPGHKGRPQAELAADGPRVLGVWLPLTLGQAWRQKLLPSGSQAGGDLSQAGGPCAHLVCPLHAPPPSSLR